MKKTVVLAVLAGLVSAYADVQREFSLNGEVRVSDDIVSDGDLGIKTVGSGTLYLDGAVSAAGTVTLTVAGETFSWGSAENTSYIRGTDVLVAPGRTLAEITVVGGWIGGGAIGTPGVATATHLEYGEGTLELFMCKQDSVNVKMRKLLFSDTDEGVVVRSLYKSYCTTDNLQLDFDNDPRAVANRTGADTVGYEVCRIDFRTRTDNTSIGFTGSLSAAALHLEAGANAVFADASVFGENGVFAGSLAGVAPCSLAFTSGTVPEGTSLPYELQGASSMEGATWYVRTGTTVKVNNAAALPSKGVVEVEGGTLQLVSRSADTYINVRKGGVLAQMCENALNGVAGITVDGGTLALSTVSYSSAQHKDDCGTYLFGITLANGARITGLPPRVGNTLTNIWKITGSSPSVCETGLKLVHNVAGSGLMFDVEDVTGDEAVDFTVNGRLYNMAEVYKGKGIVKTGAGTMRLAGENVCTGSVITVSSGVLTLGVSGALDATQPVRLEGGALAVESALAVSAGELAVKSASGIALAEGATLSFGGAEGSWAEGAALSVTGPATAFGKRCGLRVGTSRCLTEGQLASVRYNGLEVRQDEEGWIYPYKDGFRMIVR